MGGGGCSKLHLPKSHQATLTAERGGEVSHTLNIVGNVTDKRHIEIKCGTNGDRMILGGEGECGDPQQASAITSGRHIEQRQRL